LLKTVVTAFDYIGSNWTEAENIQSVSKKKRDWCCKIFVNNLIKNQHDPVQNSSRGKPHTAGEVAPTPGSSAGSFLEKVPSARKSHELLNVAHSFKITTFWGEI
jgi:hypothetical protein